jgi:hypothetical protein
MTTNAYWHERTYRVKVGLGAGPAAGTFEITMEAPKWSGPFGSLAQDAARAAFLREEICRRLAIRFPSEQVTYISATPVAGKLRPRWDRG